MQIVCNKDTKRNIIVKQIRHIMINHNIKNTDVASIIGQTDQSTSNLLNPNYRPDSSMSIDQLAVLCDAVGHQLVINIVACESDLK